MRSTIETGRYLTRQIDAVQLGKETAKNEKELSADKIAGLLKHSASWSLTREIINKYNTSAGFSTITRISKMIIMDIICSAN